MGVSKHLHASHNAIARTVRTLNKRPFRNPHVRIIGVTGVVDLCGPGDATPLLPFVCMEEILHDLTYP